MNSKRSFLKKMILKWRILPLNPMFFLEKMSESYVNSAGMPFCHSNLIICAEIKMIVIRFHQLRHFRHLSVCWSPLEKISVDPKLRETKMKSLGSTAASQAFFSYRASTKRPYPSILSDPLIFPRYRVPWEIKVWVSNALF